MPPSQTSPGSQERGPPGGIAGLMPAPLLQASWVTRLDLGSELAEWGWHHRLFRGGRRGGGGEGLSGMGESPV